MSELPQEALQQSAEQHESRWKGFLRKFGSLIAAVFGIIALGLMFAPIVSYETKIYVGDKKIKTSYPLNIVEMLRGEYPMNWSVVLTLAMLVLGIALCVVATLVKGEKAKEGWSVGAALSFLLAFCLFAISPYLFDWNVTGLSKLIENYNGTELAVGGALGIVFSLIAAFFAAVVPFQNREITVAEIAEDGILIALSFGLNFVKIPVGATGGSINFQMLPLMLIALRRGPASGLICGGLLYGFLTCLTDGYGFATFPFDYLVGFGSVAIVGFVRPFVFSASAMSSEKLTVKAIVIGEVAILVAGLLATLVRFAGSTASSMLLYGYDFAAAAEYNAVYIPVTGACAIVALMLLYVPLVKVQKAFPVRKTL